MARHTQEPWKRAGASYRVNIDEKFYVVVKWTTPVDSADRRRINEIADRIPACVNACAGIPTEALEQGVVAEMRDTLEFASIDVGGVGYDALVERIVDVLAKLESTNG